MDDSSEVLVKYKRDRVTSSNPSGELIFTSHNGRQILQAPANCYPEVKNDMVSIAKGICFGESPVSNKNHN